MSESVTEETKSVEETESVSETKDEDEVKIQEVLIPCEESKDTTLEEILKEKGYSPVTTTDITKSPVESCPKEENVLENPDKVTDVVSTIQESVQEPDNENSENAKDDVFPEKESPDEKYNKISENLKDDVLPEKCSSLCATGEIIKSPLKSSSNHPCEEIKDTSLEEILEEKQSSPVTTTEITKSPVKSCPKEENVVENLVKVADVVSTIQETVQEPDNENSENLKDNVLPEKDSSLGATTQIRTLPSKSSTNEENIEIEDKIDISSKVEEIPHNDPKDLTQEQPSSPDATTETTKSPLKSSTEEIKNKDTVTDSSSKVQETPPDKESSETSSKETSQTSPTKSSSKDEHAEHVIYTEDGSAVYTDPKTKFQYKWCAETNNWIPFENENEHYKWCNETQKWIAKNTQVTETEHYKWDAEKNEWIAKVKVTTNASELTNPADVAYDIDEDGQRIYTDKDGTVFFWDVEKNAWFPKIDDDFMARYQMSYGFIDNTSESEKEKEKRELEIALLKEKELERLVEEAKANDEASNDKTKQGLKRKGQQEPPKWFEIDPAQNTKVYVTNLPLDITLDEFTEVMSKCGMIMRDHQSNKFKLKLYTEPNGQIKGDGLCDYIKVESVDLALKIIDGYQLRGNRIRVQRAQFQMRGEYNPALKPKRKKKDKEKLAKIKEKLFDWRPEKMRGERSKHEKTVIIKNLFHPELFEKEVQLILDYQNDLREECAKCGTVRKVVVYDRHSEGVAQINMSSPEEADLVIQMMQGRFFGKRQLTAEHWDGKTKYKVEETEEEIQKRLNKWDQYLETEENKKSDLLKEEQQIDKTITEETKKSDLPKEVQDIEKMITEETDKSDDIQKEEQTITEENKKSDLPKEEQDNEKMITEEIDKSDLQKEEQDIEKTIQFEDTEKFQIIQKLEESPKVEELQIKKSDLSNAEQQDIEKMITEETENLDLQKEEQDIEKTIKFEDSENSQITQKIEEETQKIEVDTQKIEEETQKVEEQIPKVEEETQKVEEETQIVEEETQKVEVVTRKVEVETQSVEENTQKVEEETQKVDTQISDENLAEV